MLKISMLKEKRYSPINQLSTFETKLDFKQTVYYSYTSRLKKQIYNFSDPDPQVRQEFKDYQT